MWSNIVKKNDNPSDLNENKPKKIIKPILTHNKQLVLDLQEHIIQLLALV